MFSFQALYILWANIISFDNVPSLHTKCGAKELIQMCVISGHRQNNLHNAEKNCENF